MDLHFLMPEGPKGALETSSEAPVTVTAAPIAAPEATMVSPISLERVAVHMRLQAWLDERQPGAPRVPGWTPAPDPGYSVTTSASTSPAVPMDAETVAEMRAAQAWRAGDQAGFEAALALLPEDIADQHRRVAASAERVRGLVIRNRPTPGDRP